MSKKDLYHNLVRRALEKDGWKITHDPLVKNFLNLSLLHDFYEALGQFKFYWFALRKSEPERKLFLAVSVDIYSEFFDDPFIIELMDSEHLHILVFDINKEIITKWIK